MLSRVASFGVVVMGVGILVAPSYRALADEGFLLPPITNSVPAQNSAPATGGEASLLPPGVTPSVTQNTGTLNVPSAPAVLPTMVPYAQKPVATGSVPTPVHPEANVSRAGGPSPGGVGFPTNNASSTPHGFLVPAENSSEPMDKWISQQSQIRNLNDAIRIKELKRKLSTLNGEPPTGKKRHVSRIPLDKRPQVLSLYEGTGHRNAVIQYPDGGVYWVHEGDDLPGGYKVAHIEGSVVTIKAGSIKIRLPLAPAVRGTQFAPTQMAGPVPGQPPMMSPQIPGAPPAVTQQPRPGMPPGGPGLNGAPQYGQQDGSLF